MSPHPQPRRRPPAARIAAAAGVAVVVAGGVLALAASMDTPVADGPRDRAPIVAGVVNPLDRPLTGADQALPALAPVLSRPISDDLGQLPPEQQVVRLRERIATAPTARRYTELGRAQMQLEDTAAADASFAAAARLAPQEVEPVIGRLMVRATTGDRAMDAAAAELAALQRRFPQNQSVTFNRGWLALYRRDLPTVRKAWTATAAIDPNSSLGQLAGALLARLDSASG